MRRRSPGSLSVVLGLGLLGSAACDQAVPGEHRLTSLRLSLTSPLENQLGTPSSAVQPSALTFDVDALDEHGKLMPISSPIDAFLVTGGSRLSVVDTCQQYCVTPAPAPQETGTPTWLLSRIPMSGGQARGVTVRFDSALAQALIFGRVTLNLEEPESAAAGATPPIYFPNPTITGLVKPITPGRPSDSCCTPLLNRQITVDGVLRTGGKLVVSSLFQNGLAVTDTSAVGTTGLPEYASIYVFTFSRPSTDLRIGKVIRRLSGAMAKFNGMTQLGNPVVTAGTEFMPQLLPKLAEIGGTLRPKSKPEDNGELVKLIASPVRISGVICEVFEDDKRRDNYDKYNTVTINQDDTDPASIKGCGGINRTDFDPNLGNRTSVALPGKGFGGFDPDKHARASTPTEATFTGMLQNGASKSGKTLFWTVVLREATDVCLKPKAQCP
ncbi:MAG: hypothetical protein U1A78_31990 [Polyangia bacterium]